METIKKIDLMGSQMKLRAKVRKFCMKNMIPELIRIYFNSQKSDGVLTVGACEIDTDMMEGENGCDKLIKYANKLALSFNKKYAGLAVVD